MTHPEFVQAYAAGRVRVDFDPKLAGRFLSAQLMLPFFMLPILGAGVALALIGWIWTGLAIIAAAIIVPRLMKRSAPHFLLTQALEDEKLYDELMRTQVARVVML